jgi:hypothetical protein
MTSENNYSDFKSTKHSHLCTAPFRQFCSESVTNRYNEFREFRERCAADIYLLPYRIIGYAVGTSDFDAQMSIIKI